LNDGKYVRDVEGVGGERREREELGGMKNETEEKKEKEKDAARR
jgi:hypothetical protein